MTEFILTSPEGKRYRVTGPEGATREQAFGVLQKQIASGSAKEEPTKTEPKKVGPLSGDDIPGWGFMKDYLKSIPQGMVKGATRAASRLGQAEEPMAAGAIGEASKPVPGPAASAKLGGIDRLPAQAPGLAGTLGGFTGEVLGTPTVGMPGFAAKAISGVGARGASKLAEGLGKETFNELPGRLPGDFFRRGPQGAAEKVPHRTLPENKAANIIAKRRAEDAAAAKAAKEKADAENPVTVVMNAARMLMNPKKAAATLAAKAAIATVPPVAKALGKLPKGASAAAAGDMYEQ